MEPEKTNKQANRQTEGDQSARRRVSGLRRLRS